MIFLSDSKILFKQLILNTFSQNLTYYLKNLFLQFLSIYEIQQQIVFFFIKPDFTKQ